MLVVHVGGVGDAGFDDHADEHAHVHAVDQHEQAVEQKTEEGHSRSGRESRGQVEQAEVRVELVGQHPDGDACSVVGEERR